MSIENEVKKIFDFLKIKKNSTLYVAGNIFSFGIESQNVFRFCEALYNNILKKIRPNGNLIVPTATYQIPNTNTIFHKNLKSYVMGIFSEHVRIKKNSFRSSHALWSFAGVGKDIKKILSKTPVSAFGADSVFDRLLNYNSYFLCLGEPHNVLAMIHYVETIVGVPYRYNKEFEIKVLENGKLKKKTYSLLVLFKPSVLERDYNRKIIKILKKKKIFKSFRFKMGKIYLCNYKLLIKELKLILIKNPKIWLKNEKIKQKIYHKDNYGHKFSKKKN